MATVNWYRNLENHLQREYRHQRRELALFSPFPADLESQLSVIQDLILHEMPSGAASDQARILALLYPDLASEIWAHQVLWGDLEQARRLAGELVRHADALGLIGQVDWSDLEECDPPMWMEVDGR